MGLQPALLGAPALREDCCNPSCCSSAGCGRREGSGQVGLSFGFTACQSHGARTVTAPPVPSQAVNGDSPVPPSPSAVGLPTTCRPRLWWEGRDQ